ncbi:phage DNA ejection protein [Escherichia coli]|uniref:phage DNA ejection protein n=1 Tax=Escherichia coli TaxID=562 RepID=UPI00185BE30F|nr:phage DNA ejection protein [Escherichia coli]EFB5266256.1 DNA injection protein [Escherichia coli]EFF1044311.1 DNA injection protein [Escherichia coli]EHW5561491.1 phage DNA ejection protein [Escherichia coli]EHY3257170.1 phage DNA ejection protein [Escherichia coli]MDP4429106.1 phage DNA ejection protein [Escherichia coli]
MATWQQGINSGGFLAGIGGQNSNAPKASDVSEALAYIRQNNEMERSGRNNIGLQALQGLGSVAQTYQAAKQQEADAAFQKEYAAAIQSGDRQQVRDLMTKYPGQLEKIQSGMKWADEDQRDEIGNLAAGGQIASMMGGDAFSKWIGNNATRLSNQGVDPQQLLSMYQKDPQATSQLIGQYGQFALGHEKYWDLQDKMVGRQQEQQRINETIRNNDMTNARAIRGQDLSYKAQMARLNHDKYVFKQSQAALERAGQLQDMDVLSLNSQIAATGIDPLTGKAATSARMSQAKRWLDGNNNYNNALITGERGIEKIDSLLGKKELEGIGRFEGRNIDGFTSAEGLANRNAIEELKSGAFVQNVQTMRGMGSLSNAEGQKLENLIAKLDITQPEEVVRKQLSEIRSQYSVFQKVAAREAESMGYSSSGYDTYVSERKSGSDSNKSGFSSLWGD